MRKKFNKGKLIWITGLSGSGKTVIAKKLKSKINDHNLFLINGDEIRDIFNLKKYDREARLKYAHSYSKLCKKLTDQGINVIIAVVAMFDEVRKWNRNNIENYHEVYIKTPLNLIKIRNKKKLYLSNKINVFGKDIKTEYPQQPDQIIKNNYKKNIDKIVDKLLIKMK